MRKETGLSRYSQETAIRKLKSLGILETKIAQVPAKRHFRLDLSKLEAIIPSLMESHNLVYLKPPSSIGVNQPTITKSTLKNTSKISTTPDMNSFFANKAKLVEKLSRSP